ncbi:hypothetical protein AAY473_035849 [Plecturocebus cupreus]
MYPKELCYDHRSSRTQDLRRDIFPQVESLRDVRILLILSSNQVKRAAEEQILRLVLPASLINISPQLFLSSGINLFQPPSVFLGPEDSSFSYNAQDVWFVLEPYFLRIPLNFV